MVESREANVIFGLSGGKYKSRVTRITIPVTWIDELEFSPEHRKAIITLDGNRIIIEKANE